MFISLAHGRAPGVNKRSDAHQPANDDDQPGGATPVAITEPPADREALEEVPLRPWVVPGVGGSF